MVAAAAVDAAAVATAEVEKRTGAPALVEARQQALLIAALRGALGLAGVGAAIVLLAIYGGDRRLRSALKFSEPEPAPGDARLESPGRALAGAAYPSTIGLAALTLISFWPRPPLAAFLAGLLLGLAVMSLAGFVRLTTVERARRTRILIDYKASRVFETRR